jgi:hypothetical protein
MDLEHDECFPNMNVGVLGANGPYSGSIRSIRKPFGVFGNHSEPILNTFLYSLYYTCIIVSLGMTMYYITLCYSFVSVTHYYELCHVIPRCIQLMNLRQSDMM